MKERDKEMTKTIIKTIKALGLSLAPLLLGGVGVGLLSSCSSSDDATDPVTVPETDPVAVSFTTDVTTESTRATTGLINNLDALRASGDGFGVFAYLTDGSNWETTFADKNIATFDGFSNFFMQNQQVTWNNSYQEGGVWQKDWVYSPLKYWPNSTDNATSRYISFFAYAPWADASTSPTTGVIDYVRDADRTPHVIYKIGAADHQVDLLWANKIDATRNGQGLINDATSPLTYQKVPLEFHHALSAIDIYVQRVYDEPAYTGKIPATVLYPTLYVSKLELKSTDVADDSMNGLQTSGKLSLIDGKWSDPGAPNAWAGAEDGEVNITYDESMINDTIRGTTDTREEFIRDIELDKWKWVLDTKNTPSTDDDEWVDATTITEEQYTATPNRWKNAYGVSEEERNFIKNSMTQVLIPRKITLIPKLTYSMVVRDDELLVNYLTDNEGHKYTRILNEVEGNSVTLDLQAGKRYTLLIRIGVEHITFELLSVVDWDFPMRFNPEVVTGVENEEIGHTVNE